MNINLDEYPVESIKKGYYYNPSTHTYHCMLCEEGFEEGEIFKIGERYYDALRAVHLHVEQAHGGVFRHLLESDSKYNTITEKQKELLGLIHKGLSDQAISQKLGVTASTVRHQRFSFREKAKQAKLYLSLYELATEGSSSEEDALIPIHEGANMIDDRYVITKEEREKILSAVFISLSPLKLKIFSAKEKKKIVILQKIMEQFEKGKIYKEKEVNQILKDIYDDFPTIRRYLIEYGFMERSKDCSDYWVK